MSPPCFQCRQKRLELNSFYAILSCYLSQVSFAAGTWCLLLFLCLVQVSDPLPCPRLEKCPHPKEYVTVHCPHWSVDGRSMQSHCSFHLTAPDNDCSRKEQKI